MEFKGVKMSVELDIQITGNPFIDSGIYALKTKLGKDLSEITIQDLKDEINNISKIYVNDAWIKNTHNIFPNSTLINNAIKGDRREKYVELFHLLIDNIDDISSNGSCIGCGRRNVNTVRTKSFIPLTGSGALKNYFSFADEGAGYCDLCVVLIQFLPLILYSCPQKNKGNFLLFHSNSEKAMNLWSKLAIKNINNQIALGKYTGCYNEGLTNPTNAVFEIIAQVISLSDFWDDESPSLNFYYFNNYNQTPYLEIYSLPTNVFSFLTEIPLEDYKNWKFIIKKSYKYVKWDKVDNVDDYKNNPNAIYNNLLNGKSILRSFYNAKFKKTYCSWKLVKSYMGEVWNMDEKRIEVIKDVGDRLSKYIKDYNRVKSLNDLELASNYNHFRNILRKILKNKINNGDEELLFTFDEYVLNLFPEGNMTWRETQDLLLFRIYENLHDWLIENKYVEEVTEEELLEEK